MASGQPWLPGALPLLMLLLGTPAEGWVHFPSPLAASRLSQLFWHKQATLYRQAQNVLQLAINHLNEKHNTTYSRAPGVPTHIMLENALGRTYHVHVVLVEAKCPEGQGTLNTVDCKIAPDAQKLECRLEITMLLASEEDPYIKDYGCKDFQEPLLGGLPNPDKEGGGEEEEEEEEGTPYI